MKKLTLFIFLLLSATTTLASVQRVIITSENQKESEIEFIVSIDQPNDTKEGYLDVVISLPAGQINLSELWKIYLWVKEPSLSIPIDLGNGENNELEIRFRADINIIKQATVAIRCGKSAPAAEKIYQVELGTFIKTSKTYNKALQRINR